MFFFHQKKTEKNTEESSFFAKKKCQFLRKKQTSTKTKPLHFFGGFLHTENFGGPNLQLTTSTKPAPLTVIGCPVRFRTGPRGRTTQAKVGSQLSHFSVSNWLPSLRSFPMKKTLQQIVKKPLPSNRHHGQI